MRGVPVAGCAGVLLAGMTMYGNYPALDRSRDTRPADLLSAFTAAADDNRAIVITALNWQVENGLNYFLRDVRRDIAAAHIADVLPHAPRLIEDNARIRRAVLLSSTARDELMAAYPSRYRAERDTRAIAPTLTGAASRLRPGTRYVLTVLKPTRTMTIDRDDLGGALRALGAGAATLTLDRYEAVAGLAGQPPVFAGGSAVPFRRTIELAGTPVDIRMESWLAFDTIRRMGFGQIVAHRRHTLIVERGVSLVAFDEDGRPLETTYAASLFAPEPRWAIVDP
jgi:hypothetical protein